MKKVAIEPVGGSALVTTGTSLLSVLLEKDMQVLMACGGKGICSTCHVKVCGGMDQLSPMGARERRTLSLVADTTPESRLACQTSVHGEGVVIRVPEGMYIERAEDLLSLLGKPATENILHPVTGAILIPRGKMITRTLLEQSRSIEQELKKLRESETNNSPPADSGRHANFTASGLSTRPNFSSAVQVTSRSSRVLPPVQEKSASGTRTPVSVPAVSTDSLVPANSQQVSQISSSSTLGVTPAPVVAIQPGVTVDKYLLLECVGKGGAGVVYRALHTKLKNLVAVKFLRPDQQASDHGALHRLAREAQFLAQLNHPNVVRVIDFEDHPTRPYVVMEFVDGLTVSDLIKQSGRISPLRSIEIILDVAAGLEAAWKLEIVHRDVKPGNILVARDGRSKLVDLGLATISAPTSPSNARGAELSQVEGTAGYISPEAINRANVDHRSDIYSLGATLFHMLTGRLPFEGRSPYEVMMKHLQQPPPTLNKLVPGIPPHLSEIIQVTLAKDPAMRHQTYEDLRAELQEILHILTEGPMAVRRA